jgi:predicted GNAT family acetyltransferase
MPLRQVAVLTYGLEMSSIIFVHPGVLEKLQRHALTGKLAAAGLEFARQKRWTVIPLCDRCGVRQKAPRVSGSRVRRLICC